MGPTGLRIPHGRREESHCKDRINITHLPPGCPSSGPWEGQTLLPGVYNQVLAGPSVFGTCGGNAHTGRLQGPVPLARRIWQVDDMRVVVPTVFGWISPPTLLGGLCILLVASFADPGYPRMGCGPSCGVPVSSGPVSQAAAGTRVGNNGIPTDPMTRRAALRRPRT